MKRECWASPLGACDGGISGEHVVSRGLFSTSSVMVKGFEWCSIPLEVSVGSLTRNILCRKHNSALSVLDSSAIATFKVFSEAADLTDFRRKYADRRWTRRIFRVDGVLLERWFLKTMINIHFQKAFTIGLGDHGAGRAKAEDIEKVFGLRPFGASEGLHLSASVGDALHLREGLGHCPLTQGNNIVAGRFKFVGLNFLLSLYPSPLRYDGKAELIRHLKTNSYGWGKQNPANHSHQIHFSW